jgi:hypothetical protein
MYFAKVVEHFKTFREPLDKPSEESQYFDDIFLNQMYDTMIKVTRGYEEMKYRDVVKYGVYEFNGIKDEYLLSCQHTKPRRDLI